MNKTVKRLLIATGVVAAVSAVAAAAYQVCRTAASHLMTIALDREEPKLGGIKKEQISGIDGMDEVLDMLAKNGEKLAAREHETVEIVSEYDGIQLVGHWYEVKHPKRVIVAMHGWRSSWARDFGTIADFWLDNDCSVLFAEQRGQGGSGGEYMGFGLLERHDCLEWVKWASALTDEKLPIYLAGVSMGATTVLMTAGLELPDTVHGIMADCAFTSPHAIWKHVVENNLHIPYGLCRGVADDMCKKKLSGAGADYSCVDALEKSTVPVLFVHGTDDHFVPVTMTYENYKACSAPKRLLVVPGAEHGMSYLEDKDSYEAAGMAFWKEFD